MSELSVPFAVDNQQILHCPESAERGREYFCPSCHDPLSFRQGEIRSPHFAHKASKRCSQESITHVTAKLLLLQTVRDWKSGDASAPVLQRKCHHCLTPVIQSLPKTVEYALIEQRLTDNSIADVALMVGDKVLAAVEVRVTHAVDDNKAERLPVPFVELDGMDVIENPTLWKPITDSLKPVTCGKCRLTFKRFQTKAQQIADASGQILPASYYRYGIVGCWSCNRAIIVYTWPNDEGRGAHMPSRQPVPGSIHYRATKRAGRCWLILAQSVIVRRNPTTCTYQRDHSFRSPAMRIQNVPIPPT